MSHSDSCGYNMPAGLISRSSFEGLGSKSVGVDYGLARTGVAVSVGFSPVPLEVISNRNATQVCDRIVRICKIERAERIVVGLPLHKNGTEATQTVLTRLFASELAAKVLSSLGSEIAVYLWDERYTSREAAARGLGIKSAKKFHGTLDAEAAAIILESFYDENGEGAQIVRVKPAG